MKQLIRQILLLGVLYPNWSCLATFQFTEDFESGDFASNFTIQADPGSHFAVRQGHVELTQDSGVSLGGIYLMSGFRLVGDFTISVEADRSLLGSAELGLFADSTDVFFVNNNRINANFFCPGLRPSGVSVSNQRVTLRIRRTGSTVACDYDVGGGFVPLDNWSASCLEGPMSFSLFLLEEFNSIGPRLGIFDNLSITADDVLDFRPRLSVVKTGGGVLLSWPTAVSGFVLEASPILPATNGWFAVTNDVVPVGERATVLDDTTAAQRFYRLKKE